MPKKNLPDSRLNLTHFIQKRLHSKAANAKKEKKCTTRNLQNFYSRYTFRAQKPESKNVQRLAFAKIFKETTFSADSRHSNIFVCFRFLFFL